MSARTWLPVLLVGLAGCAAPATGGRTAVAHGGQWVLMLEEVSNLHCVPAARLATPSGPPGSGKHP